MFDRETAIRAWRERLAGTGSLFQGDLDELESHLRDELEALEEVGFVGSDAFRFAEEKMGESSALGEEFAKINPLLAWRVALCWLCVGCLTTLVGAPMFELLMHAVIDGGTMLGLGPTTMRAAVWTTALSIPSLFYVGYFLWLRRRVHDPLAWANAPSLRIGAIVLGAITMIAGHLHVYPVHFREWIAFGDKPAYLAAQESWESAVFTLAVLAPVGMLVLAFVLRRRAMSSRMTEAPLFWLSVGSFVAIIREELGIFVREAALAIAGLAHLGRADMRVVMWVVSLACPTLLILSSYAWVRHRSPPPRRFLASSGPLVAMTVACAAGITAVHKGDIAWNTARRVVAQDVVVDAVQTWVIANIFTAAALPVVLGAIMLRLRSAAIAR